MKRALKSRTVFLALGLMVGFFIGALWMVRRDFVLDRALHYGTLGDVQAALREGADPNKMVVTPNFESGMRKVLGFGQVGKKRSLVLAARRGDEAIVSELLSAGANPDGHDGTGWTALVEAVHAKDVAMCRLLLKAGANPNPRFKDGSLLLDDLSSELKDLLRTVKPTLPVITSP